MAQDHIHFVTGKLAEPSLRGMLQQLAPEVGFHFSVGVLKISVAALMTTDWVASRLQIPPGATSVMLPGYCRGDVAPVESAGGVPVVVGPKDLQELPDFFGSEQPRAAGYGAFDIEILAEINHVPRMSRESVLAEAARLRHEGADVIDLGCEPGEPWSGVDELVRTLRGEGFRVSIDSMNPAEIEPAVRAGAELVLSVNRTNLDRAVDWGCEVVALPDTPGTLEGLDETIERLTVADVRFRIDPVLEPIGFGFADSLGRYLEVRRCWPEAEIMMGIGNLTELTDADSAPINVLLLGFCQEVGIRSVLTTEVINWARSSVRECDLARRLVYHAVHQRVLPKHLEPALVMLRDSKLLRHGEESLQRLARQIKDPNYRLFAEDGLLHVVSRDLHITGSDAFELFAQLLDRRDKPLDASHAFYLGYEMAKAVTALTLGKQYRQDDALDWGFLTIPEPSGDARRQTGRRSEADDPDSEGKQQN